MKKNGKRFLAFVLAFCLLLTAVPVTPVQAAGKKNAVKKVTMNYTQYVLKKGQKVQLKATVSPKQKAKVQWKSSNTKVATVSKKGVVTVKTKKGSAKITATAGGKKATCKITAGTPVKKIKASDLKLKVGEKAKIGATISPKKVTNKKLTYKSSDKKVCKVDKKGKVTATGAGSAKITITSVSNGKVKKVITVTVEKDTEAAEEDPAHSQNPSSSDAPAASPAPGGNPSVTPSPAPTTAPAGECIVSLYDGQTKLSDVSLKKGTALKNISSPFVEGKVFLGWYYDSAFTKEVGQTDKLSENIVLFGKYGQADSISENGSPNYISATDRATDFTIIVDAHSASVGEADIKAGLKLYNITDPGRTDDSDVLEKDVLTITAAGNGRFKVSAQKGYQAGATYKLEITESGKALGLTFDGQTSEVESYNFTIKKEQVLNLTLNSKVKFLSADSVSANAAEQIMSYTGLYQTTTDPDTGETVTTPTNNSGVFEYDKEEYTAGDVLAVYRGTRPDQRTLATSLDESIAYIKIVGVEGNQYAYKSAQAEEVLFTPDMIPVDVDENDGTTGWTLTGTSFEIENELLDFSDAKFAQTGLDYQTVAEPGDFVAFYTGEYGADDAISQGYGKITKVEADEDTTHISYETVSYEDMMSAMDVYKKSDLTKEQMDAIDEQQIIDAVTMQVEESGFAQEAGRYLAVMALETDEISELAGENMSLKNCIITYEDGTEISGEELADLESQLADEGKQDGDTEGSKPEVSVSVSKDLTHFDSGSGIRVEIAITYGFDVQKDGGKAKIAVEMTALFETEVTLAFSANGGAVWKTKWIIPYIYDYKMSGSIDQGLYTGIAVTATAQLEEADEPEEAPVGKIDKNDKNTNVKDKIVNLGESIKEKLEESEDGESIADTASGGLREKYQKFVQNASEDWIDLVSVPVLESAGTLDPFNVTAYSINVDFVVSANMSVAVGMSFWYEKVQRHTFTMLVLHKKDSTSQTVDLSPERYQFDFYVMGKLGIRAGVRAKVLFGLFSTDIAGIGMQIEAGAYAKLWGYFYYCLSWEQGKDKESSARGAMLVEVGAYLDLKLALEAIGGKLSFQPTLYSHEWPIWQAGEQDHVLDFAYDEDGVYVGDRKSYNVPTSFKLVREKSKKVSTNLFRMQYIDLTDGNEGIKNYDSDKKGSGNDEERFFVEMSDPVFSYDPVTNQILVNPEKGKYSYEATMTITWKRQDFTFNTKPISRTFTLKYIDPDAGKCLTFDTQGGSLIDTQVYGPGAVIDRKYVPKDPEKTGYAFGGWYLDKECTKKTEVPEKMPSEDLTLYAKWDPVPNEYTVRHFYEDLSSKYVEKTEYRSVQTLTEVYTGEKGKRIYTDDALTLERVSADNAKTDHGFEVAFIRGDNTVAPDGSSVVDIYYKRQIHTVHYKMGEVEDADNPDTDVRYRYGESIIEPAYFVYGYTFSGWDQPIADTMDTEDLTYTAQWKPNENTPYYLEYYVKNPKTGEYMMLGGNAGRLYKEGITNDTVYVKNNRLSDTSYTLKKVTVNGKTVDAYQGTGKIDAFGKLTIAYFYEGGIYDIAYDTAGGILKNTANVPRTYVHGVPQSLVDITAQRDGYNFIGWLEGNQAITEITANRTGNIRLTAEWRAKKSEIRLFDEDGKTLLGTVTAFYDKTLPTLNHAQMPKKDGYDFAGYFDENDSMYYDAEGKSVIFWDKQTGLDLKAKWTKKHVTISFDTDGADEEATPAPLEGTYLENYPALPVVEKLGYELLGWYEKGSSGEELITQETKLESYEPVTLVAKWGAKNNTPYTLELYVEADESSTVSSTDMPADTAGYQLFTSYTLYGKTDEEISVTEDNYGIPGYVFDSENPESVLSAVVKADGSTVLKRFYNKAEYYTMQFTDEKGLVEKKIRAIAGTKIELPAYTELADGQQLSGWKDDLGVYYTVGSYTVPEENRVFTAVWEQGQYTIKYNRSGTGTDSWMAVEQIYKTGEDITIPGCVYTPSYGSYEGGDGEEEDDTEAYYYAFKDWTTQRDGGGTHFTQGEVVTYEQLMQTEFEENGKLFAQFKKVPLEEGMVPYYVIYHIQDSSGMFRGEDVQEKYGIEGEDTDAEEYELKGFTSLDIIPGTEETIIKQKKILTGENADNDGADAYTGYTVINLYYQRDCFDLQLDYDGGTFRGSSQLSVTGIVLDNSNVDYWIRNATKTETENGVSSISEIIPEKEGYTFIGWDASTALKDNGSTTMPAHNITAKAVYQKTNLRTVTVEYYTENTDGDETYTLAYSEKRKAEAGAEFSPEPKELNGYETPERKTLTVADDGSSVCQYYYIRKTYKLTWDAGDGTISGNDVQTEAKYGAAVTAPVLVRAGYTGSFKNFTGKMPAADTVYEAEWTPQDVTYIERYRKQAKNGSYETFVTKTREAKAGTELTVKPQPGDSYTEMLTEGYVAPMEQKAIVSGDGTTEIVFDYALKIYALHLDFSGAENGTNVSPAGMHYAGDQMWLPPLKYLTRTGYTVEGWYDVDDESQTVLTTTSILMGNKDTTYKLKCTPNTYTITYDLAVDGATNPNNPTSYQTGLDFNIAGAMHENMAFVGWEWAGTGKMPDGVTKMSNGLMHVTESTQSDLSFKAVWEDEYLTFAANLSEDTSELYTYLYPKRRQDEITLADITPPVRENYMFAYWMKLVPKETSGYYEVVLDDKTEVSALNVNRDQLTAQWMELTKMEGYEDAYSIHVKNETEFELAAECLKQNMQYRGITIDQDFTVNNRIKPFMDILDAGYVIDGKGKDGKNHTITFEKTSVPLVTTNFGTIRNLTLYSNGRYACTKSETYFGLFADINRGTITGCSLSGSTNEDGSFETTIVSNAEYTGGIAGYNAGTITDCQISDTTLLFDNTMAEAEQTVNGFIGGIAGRNDYAGVISGCREENVKVAPRTGYMKETDLTVYMGAVAGISQGTVRDGSVTACMVGNTSDVYNTAVGKVYAGGVAGTDQSALTDAEDAAKAEETAASADRQIGGIYSYTVKDTTVKSETVAGGIIAVLNAGIISTRDAMTSESLDVTLSNVSVYGDREYAGLAAGICSTERVSSGIIWIENSRAEGSERAAVSVVAGKVNLPENFNSRTVYMTVRLKDNDTKTAAMNASNSFETTAYKKGTFYYVPVKNGDAISFTDMYTFLSPRW